MKKLAGLRVTAGLTQTVVAKALGITQGAISIWERGDGQPTLDKIPLLANLYKVTEQEIVEAIMSLSHNLSIAGKEVSDNDEREQVVLQNLSGTGKVDTGASDCPTGDSRNSHAVPV